MYEYRDCEKETAKQTPYEQRINAFYDGIIAGVRMFARYKDGTKVVGVTEIPINDEIRLIEESRTRALADAEALQKFL
jgi:hypothetical protein